MAIAEDICAVLVICWLTAIVIAWIIDARRAAHRRTEDRRRIAELRHRKTKETMDDTENYDWIKNVPDEVLDDLELVVKAAIRDTHNTLGMPIDTVLAIASIRDAVDAAREDREDTDHLDSHDGQ